MAISVIPSSLNWPPVVSMSSIAYISMSNIKKQWQFQYQKSKPILKINVLKLKFFIEFVIAIEFVIEKLFFIYYHF